jgi:hypothetical protein
VNGRSYPIGWLELVSLAELRDRARGVAPRGIHKVRNVCGDIGGMHQAPQYAGGLFQVDSQFNLSEIAGPEVTAEDGRTRSQFDRAQGRACAMAAGAATIMGNYFAPVGEQLGQTAERQLDGLADIGAALATALGMPIEALWRMQNGYAFCSAEGLRAINGYLSGLLPRALPVRVHREPDSECSRSCARSLRPSS